jgi:hypothetical protein
MAFFTGAQGKQYVAQSWYISNVDFDIERPAMVRRAATYEGSVEASALS